MKKNSLIFVLLSLLLAISSICSAGGQKIYKSVYVARLTPDQFLALGMPKDRCSPWVMWETDHPEIPRVVIIHVAETGRKPRLHVISRFQNQEAFTEILQKIKGFWHATGISPIETTKEGDLIAIITFPGQTIDMHGKSTMIISNKILVNVKEHEVFLGQVDEFARKKDLYKKSTIDLLCYNLPADIVNNFPYPNKIAAR